MPPRGLIGHFFPKHLAKLLKTGAQIWIWSFKYVTPVYKPKEVFVYWFVLRKTFSQVFEIHFHFPNICISKTCVKQGNSEIRKLGIRGGFDSTNMKHL